MSSSKTPSFIHLRTHSAYSLLEGAIQVKALVSACKKEKMPAVALTDTGNLFGSLEFSLAACESGVQPIIGCSCQISIGTDKHDRPELAELLLLAKDQEGYLNLLKLVSDSFLHGRGHQQPFIPLEELKMRREGLIALTGGTTGILAKYLINDQRHVAEQWLLQLKELFPDRLYIELQRHGLEAEARIEPTLIQLAYDHHIPLVATNDVYFATPDMHEAHDALICIAGGTFVMEENRRRYTPEHYFKSPAAMAELFADIPEAIANTRVIARRCSVMAEARAPMLPAYPTHDGKTQEEELRALSLTGLKKRLETHVWNEGMSEAEKEALAKPYYERLEFELDVITRMQYSGYFLIVSDFIRWSKENGIPVGPGRGSGAGSVIAWALSITDLDPLRFGLLFERFLNPERVSMPDFDIDFCQERRDEVIRYVQEKYGRDKVAQIITFGKLQARAVLRDVGRVLQMSYNHVDSICKLIPFNPLQPVMLADAIKMDPQLQKERDRDENVARLLDIGLKLEGLYRHASTHAAGIVIGSQPLHELIPVYHDPRSDMPVTGYSMKHAEMAGLVKFDFLGLKTLTIIERTCRLLRERNITIDLEKLPFDDKATFDMLSQGDATGVFQMESAGMRDALRKMKPDTIEDIIALISLYRPGPMENIPVYIARKHGKEKPDYLHPMLEPILKETFGVIIYQEQVMQIAQVLAGYSLGAADLLRRAMGKKIKEEMDAQRDQFVQGAVANGVNKGQANFIFDLVAKFAGYGFNKSHAAAYAVIGYQTAYLKANYPVEFLTATMNIDIGNTDQINLFRLEAQRKNIRILPPDINKSGAVFVPEALENPAPKERKRGIRYALGALKNVGLEAMRAVVREREANGPFKDVFDVAARCDSKVLNKRQLESLAKSGAFDSLCPNRRQIHDAASLLTRYSQSATEERTSNQVSLFSGFQEADSPIPLPTLPNVADWERDERLLQEFHAIGFYLSAHPLDRVQRELDLLGFVPTAELEQRVTQSGNVIHMAGIVTATTHRAASGRRFAYIQLSDPSGSCEISIFNEDLINRARDLIEGAASIALTIEARKDEGGVRLFANDIVLLSDFLKDARGVIKIHLEHCAALPAIHTAFATQEAGNMQCVLVLVTREKMRTEIALPQRFTLHQALLSELSTIPGVLKLQCA